MTPLSADALGDQLQQRIRAADHLPGLIERHEYMHGLIPEPKAAIMDLRRTEPDHDAIMRCIDTFHRAVDAFKARHAFARLPYSPEVDARYPFRDEAFNPICIGAPADLSRPDGVSHGFGVDTVWPYLLAPM